MRRTSVVLVLLALVLAALVVMPGQASSTQAPPGIARAAPRPAEPALARSGGTRVVAPARIGKATIGMTVAEAMATGQFNADVANPPCDPIPLQPKKPYKRQYVVLVSDDRIVEMDAWGHRMRTATGVRTGSTYRKVKRSYPGAVSRPREVGYGQWGVYVSRGKKGPGRRWIGFLFGNAAVEDGPLAKSDTVTLMGVTKGKRPPLLLDGC